MVDADSRQQAEEDLGAGRIPQTSIAMSNIPLATALLLSRGLRGM